MYVHQYLNAFRPGSKWSARRRAREPRALSESRRARLSGTSDSRSRRRSTARRWSSTTRARPTARSRTFKLPRAARAARLDSRRVRVGRAAVDGDATPGAARPDVRLRAVVSEGRRLRSRRLGAESARAGRRAVRRVRHVRRHDGRARRPGARVDRRSGRAAIRDGRACRERVRRGSATDAYVELPPALAARPCRTDFAPCGSSRTTCTTSRGARRRTIGTRAASYVRPVPTHALSRRGTPCRCTCCSSRATTRRGAAAARCERTIFALRVARVDLGTVRLSADHERASARSGRHRVPDDDHGRHRRRRG